MNTERSSRQSSEIRIIGGQFRGSKLRFLGRADTRPMKHRVREAIFNLVGPSIKGSHAIDLFAGTGAVGLEALSRGAQSATFVEQHIPTARIIEENIASLKVVDRATVVTTNALVWLLREVDLPETSWSVFVAPPYDYYVDRREEMLALVERLLTKAPPSSVFLVEADERFDFKLLPSHQQWDVRAYPPAVVGILRR